MIRDHIVLRDTVRNISILHHYQEDRPNDGSWNAVHESGASLYIEECANPRELLEIEREGHLYLVRLAAWRILAGALLMAPLPYPTADTVVGELWQYTTHDDVEQVLINWKREHD